MEGRKFKLAKDALQFIEAGDAIFTLVSRTTGNRYTYRVQIPRDVREEQNSTMPTARHCELCGEGQLAEAAVEEYFKKKVGFTFAHQTCAVRRNPSAQPYKFRFVKLLTGNDNNNDYTYIGVLHNGQFRTTIKSSVSLDAPSVKALDYTLLALKQRKEIPSTLEIWHVGRCGRCGRRLTVPSSIEAGIGPECAGRM